MIHREIAIISLTLVWTFNSFAGAEGEGQICESLRHFQAHRYVGNPVILHGGSGWKDSQVMEPCIVDDPEDSTQLVMFFASMAAPVAYGVMSIGVATASKVDPYTWKEHPDNPLMSPGLKEQWDDQWIRLDSVVPLGGNQFRIFYTGHGTDMKRDQVGTAVCGKRGDHWDFVREETNPILIPSGDERDVSQAAVIKDGDRWYMYYSYRTQTKTLPGVRLAVSDDGVRFTKSGVEVLSLGSEGEFDSRFIEWHQIKKVGGDFVMLYEAYNRKNWSIGMARSKDPTSVFEKSARNPVFERSNTPGAFDEDHVATPAIYCVEGQWMLFYSGANEVPSDEFAYSFSNWDMGIADLKPQ